MMARGDGGKVVWRFWGFSLGGRTEDPRSVNPWVKLPVDLGMNYLAIRSVKCR